MYQRDHLEPGVVIVGPCLIEQADSTVLVDEKLKGSIDSYGNLIMELDS